MCACYSLHCLLLLQSQCWRSLQLKFWHWLAIKVVIGQISQEIHSTLSHDHIMLFCSIGCSWGLLGYSCGCQGISEDYFWSEFSEQTRQYGPFRSTDGHIILLIPCTQNELISITVWHGWEIWAVTPADKLSISELGIFVFTHGWWCLLCFLLISNIRCLWCSVSNCIIKSSVCVACGLWSGSVAIGCKDHTEQDRWIHIMH